MSKSLFIEMWAGLRDLMGDNNTPGDINDAKRFINWTIRDLSQQYDWEFLRGTKSLTATGGSGVYDLSDIAQISATAETIYVQTDASADDGSIVTIFGKQIAASSTLNISSDPVTIVATATASGSIVYSHIDSIRKAASTGSITVTTSAGGVISTLAASETYKSNDIRKINYITDDSNQKRVHPYDDSTYELGNPNGSSLGNFSAYDLDHESMLKLFNVDANTVLSIIYQRVPRWLIKDQDRSEYPESFISKIVNASYEGYGLRYRDQQDATLGKQRYLGLLRDIVSDWLVGKDQPVNRIMPAWIKRKL
jgi:hypothetical protein